MFVSEAGYVEIYLSTCTSISNLNNQIIIIECYYVQIIENNTNVADEVLANFDWIRVADGSLINNYIVYFKVKSNSLLFNIDIQIQTNVVGSQVKFAQIEFTRGTFVTQQEHSETEHWHAP